MDFIDFVFGRTLGKILLLVPIVIIGAALMGYFGVWGKKSDDDKNKANQEGKS